jgi:hypothetical protein
VRRRWLGTLALVPLMLGGCGSKGTDSATAAPAPSGSSFVLVANGKATPSPAPSQAGGTAGPFPTGFLPLPSNTPPAATPAPSASCVEKARGQIGNAAAVTSATSANVTWYNPGGNDLTEFRITAISENLATGEQRDVGWTVMTPGATCGFMTGTLTGLDSKTYYVFSVDAVRRNLGKDGTRAETIARSLPTRTL